MANPLWKGLTKAIGVGAAYVEHSNFAKRAADGTEADAVASLSAYVRDLSDASFTGLKMTLAWHASQEKDTGRKARFLKLAEQADGARRNNTSTVKQSLAAPHRSHSAAAPTAVGFEADLGLVDRWHRELNEEELKTALVTHVTAMDEGRQIQWGNHLARMCENCAANIEAHEATRNDAFGTSFEDRMAYMQARMTSGQEDPKWLRKQQELQQLDAFFNGLINRTSAIILEQTSQKVESQKAFLEAELARRAKLKEESEMPQNAARTPDDILAALKEAMTSGSYPGGPEQQKTDMMAMIAAGRHEEVMELLNAHGADEGGDEMLSSADYFRPGTGQFALIWPVSFPLPVPFEECPPDVQFNVLFSEWVSRMAAAHAAMHQGDNGGAHVIFSECLERARQIKVQELVARSHEGLAKVAEKTNERTAARAHLHLAQEARANPDNA